MKEDLVLILEFIENKEGKLSKERKQACAIFFQEIMDFFTLNQSPFFSLKDSLSGETQLIIPSPEYKENGVLYISSQAWYPEAVRDNDHFFDSLKITPFIETQSEVAETILKHLELPWYIHPYLSDSLKVNQGAWTIEGWPSELVLFINNKNYNYLVAPNLLFIKDKITQGMGNIHFNFWESF